MKIDTREAEEGPSADTIKKPIFDHKKNPEAFVSAHEKFWADFAKEHPEPADDERTTIKNAAIKKHLKAELSQMVAKAKASEGKDWKSFKPHGHGTQLGLGGLGLAGLGLAGLGFYQNSKLDQKLESKELEKRSLINRIMILGGGAVGIIGLGLAFASWRASSK